MPDDIILDIWSPDTGITDYSHDPSALGSEEASQIRRQWDVERSLLVNSEAIGAFTDRLNREWSIETGIIENLYDIDRGVTQTLIEEGFQKSILVHGSINQDPSYILNLLEDQQLALESLFAFVKRDRPLTNHYIRELHQLMTRSQEFTEAQNSSGGWIQVPLLRGEWKRHPNYPVRDGVVHRYCPPEQVASEMDKLIRLHSDHLAQGTPPEVEAAWLHHRFTQIHPFMDGNGRVARSLATLVLIRGGLFPMVIPREEKSAYIKCLELADKGDLLPLIRTIVRRQGAAMAKALVAVRLARKEPPDLQSAAELLGDLVRDSPEQVARRIASKTQALTEAMRQHLASITNQAATVLREKAQMADVYGTLLSCKKLSSMEGAEEDARQTILTNTGDIASPPVATALVRAFFLGGASLALLGYAPMPESSDRLVLQPCLLHPEMRLLALPSWTWEGDGVLDQESLRRWLEDAVRLLILEVGRRS